jgi:HEAT repeat protein
MRQCCHKFALGRKRWALISLLLLVLGITIAVRFEPNARTVRRLVAQVGWNGHAAQAAAYDLAPLGPKAYPELARLLRTPDPNPHCLYVRCWENGPSWIRRLLPDPHSKDDTRLCAQLVVSSLGPAAARALVGALHDSVRKDTNATTAVLACLDWSIPESPMAVMTLREWLSKPLQQKTFVALPDADLMWRHVPQLAPMLVYRLTFPGEAMAAAQRLGAMGSNAVSAIPGLVETSEKGIMAPSNAAVGFTIRANLLENRCAAIEALGNIGVATPPVLSALERAWGEGLDIEEAAADAIGKFGVKAITLLPNLLARLDTSNHRLALEYQIEAIGKMGPAARAAVPILRSWTDGSRVASLPWYPRSSFTMTEMSRGRNGVHELMPLPAGAALALVQIAPEEAKGFGHLISEALWANPDPVAPYDSVDLLRRLRPLTEEIVPLLMPCLQDSRQWLKQLTAFQILCLEPDHESAKAVLIAAMRQTDPSLRAQAAIYYWRITGDTNQVLPVFQNTLGTLNDFPNHSPLAFIAELGPSAKSLVPQIQALLTNQDQSIRFLAGTALRRIDPSALPPINEGYP